MVKWALQSGWGGDVNTQESAEQQLWRPQSTTGIQPWANRSPNSGKYGGFGKSEAIHGQSNKWTTDNPQRYMIFIWISESLRQTCKTEAGSED